MCNAIYNMMRRLRYREQHDGRGAGDWPRWLKTTGANGNTEDYVTGWCRIHRYKGD